MFSKCYVVCHYYAIRFGFWVYLFTSNQKEISEEVQKNSILHMGIQTEVELTRIIEVDFLRISGITKLFRKAPSCFKEFL